MAGRGAYPGFSVYNASKWGLEGLSEAMRYELGPMGIDVVIVEPGPFSTNFTKNVVPPKNESIASAYTHVGEFLQGITSNFAGMFEDENAPTDPMLVVQAFENLIEQPNGSRPMRTVVGVDFGSNAFNDATEPFRKGGLDAMGIAEWDGPQE